MTFKIIINVTRKWHELMVLEAKIEKVNTVMENSDEMFKFYTIEKINLTTRERTKQHCEIKTEPAIKIIINVIRSRHIIFKVTYYFLIFI